MSAILPHRMTLPFPSDAERKHKKQQDDKKKEAELQQKTKQQAEADAALYEKSFQECRSLLAKRLQSWRIANHGGPVLEEVTCQMRPLAFDGSAHKEKLFTELQDAGYVHAAVIKSRDGDLRVFPLGVPRLILPDPADRLTGGSPNYYQDQIEQHAHLDRVPPEQARPLHKHGVDTRQDSGSPWWNGEIRYESNAAIGTK